VVVNSRHSDENRGHIDPGDVPPARKGWIDPADADWGPPQPATRNPDPINRPHFAPEGSATFTSHEVYPTAAQLVKEYDTKAKPEREGPDYAAGEEGHKGIHDELWLGLGMSADVIPERAQWILQQPAMSALRSFVQHQLVYNKTDESLGLQGQFAEIHHITAKLRRTIWDRRVTIGPVNEVKSDLESLIGHALLALDLLDKGNIDGRG
jgi:hypothetical protein